jgi:16S rRNA (guanine527-N7)-methyltransferase
VSPEEFLGEGLRNLDIPASQEAIRAFLLYLEELKKWNRAYNLTSITEDREIVIKHFLDSALYINALKAIGGPPGRSIADVGSGAGFPGIPLKILKPELAISLIEPSGKKCAFLRNMKRKLGLDLEVIEKRVEEVKGNFDIALTRALTKAPDFIKKSRHIVKKGGHFILSKGPRYEEELAGLAVEQVISIPLPFADAQRYLVVIKNS